MSYGSFTQPQGSSQFSPTEFVILRESITQNIGIIRKHYNKLEKFQKLIGSKNDTPEARTKMWVMFPSIVQHTKGQQECQLFSFFSQSIQKNTNVIIQTTSSDIKKLNSIVKFCEIARTTEKTHRLLLEKIMNEFQLIVQKFLQLEKSLSIKMRKTLLVNVDDDEDSDEDTSQQQKKLEQANLNFEKELLVEREQQFQKIESDVIDINQIMNEISTLINGEHHAEVQRHANATWHSSSISEQGENIQTIDNSISTVAQDVEGGVSELQKAANHQQKFRRKMLIILIIALIVAFIVVFSLYSKLKNWASTVF